MKIEQVIPQIDALLREADHPQYVVIAIGPGGKTLLHSKHLYPKARIEVLENAVEKLKAHDENGEIIKKLWGQVGRVNGKSKP